MNQRFSVELASWADYNLKNCIGVDECMKACPTVDPALTIGEINEASRGGHVSEAMFRFAAACVQCARCDTVCPTATGRSILMLKLKERMAAEGRAPAYHRKYFALKGHDKSAARQAAFNVWMKAKWRLDPRERLKNDTLARHIDAPAGRCEFLLYFGCYIFTRTMSAAHTMDIARRLGIDYGVLGGLASCCGWPSLLAGRTAEADDYHAHLARLIEPARPAYVVTGCAECYMALVRLREAHGMDFTPLTTPMWLEMFADRLGLRPADEVVTYHDSCHISRKLAMPQPARTLLNRLAPVAEMPRSGPRDTFCCGYWGLKGDPPVLARIHQSRFEEARATGARRMVVECVSCLESFSGSAVTPAMPVVDIVTLARERMGTKPS